MAGQNYKKELLRLTDKQLPEFLKEIFKKIFDLKNLMNYYTDFRKYIL